MLEQWRARLQRSRTCRQKIHHASNWHPDTSWTITPIWTASASNRSSAMSRDTCNHMVGIDAVELKQGKCITPSFSCTRPSPTPPGYSIRHCSKTWFRDYRCYLKVLLVLHHSTDNCMTYRRLWDKLVPLCSRWCLASLVPGRQEPWWWRKRRMWRPSFWIVSRVKV